MEEFAHLQVVAGFAYEVVIGESHVCEYFVGLI